MDIPQLVRLASPLVLLCGQLAAAGFEQEVLPILSKNCVSCHGPQVQMAGLGLHDVSSALKGGTNGPVIQPGDADASVLMQRLVAGTMPPGGVRLDDQDLETIKAWIRSVSPNAAASAAGASTEYVSSITDENRNFWSFRPLSHPAPPAVSKAEADAVDHFLLEKLEAEGLGFSSEASRAHLIRRASFDLIGLPPTPEEIASFEQDPSADAYERVVDRLLASPHFGERWGRHWLDVAGYVDTFGRDVQANGYLVGPGRWRYRDYVVAAFNQDKPYDRFLLEQIAGDQLVDWREAKAYTPEIVDALTATGYLRTVEDPTNANERDTELLRYSVLHQTIEILTSGVTGLTVACARCHTHKFDPIPQRDYYRLMAMLAPAYNVEEWVQPQDRVLADVPPAERRRIDEHNEAKEAEIKPLAAKQAEIVKRGEEAHVRAYLAGCDAVARPTLEQALATPAKKRSDEQKQLLAKAKLEKIGLDAALAALPPEERETYSGLKAKIAALQSEKLSYNKLESLYDVGPAPVTRLHQRGDHESLGDVVPPGGLEVLEEPGDFAGAPEGERRLALARWLTDAKGRAGALVARVMVNRIWAHLFGEGLVSTVDNFGAMGVPPSHPELLEWLASEFQRSGWRIKPMIRRLMLTEAYRQSSTRSGREAGAGPDPEQVDPDNRLLWRMRTRRLESEVIRDSMLAVSGKLDPRLGGPPIPTKVQADGMVVFDEDKMAAAEDRYRRSLYLVARRRFSLSMLGVFDHPVMSTNATQRSSSAVVLQSLMMLNDEEVNEQAVFFARRVAEAAGGDPGDRISRAFRVAFGRPPADDELDWALAFYEREKERFQTSPSAEISALAGICHVLLNSNEFLYVE